MLLYDLKFKVNKKMARNETIFICNVQKAEARFKKVAGQSVRQRGN